MTNPADASGLARMARLPFLPALTHLDARFAAVFEHLHDLERRAQQRQETLIALLNDTSAQGRLQVAELAEQIHADAQAVTQNSGFVERAAETVAAAADHLQVPLSPRPQSDRQHREALLQGHAHDSPLAQAGFWFNPPVVVRNGAHGFELDQVHERILEVPFVYSCLAAVPPGGAVLDVGSAESTVAYSLAALGYRTTALDQRGYPLPHPNLQIVTASIAVWPGPADHSLDAIVCLSTLEHLGLKAYGTSQENPNLDRETMARFHRWLKPGGLLALTVPYGQPAVTDFERTYGPAQLDALLAGWTVKERRLYARAGRADWAPRMASAGDWPADLRGVALVAAVPA